MFSIPLFVASHFIALECGLLLVALAIGFFAGHRLSKVGGPKTMTLWCRIVLAFATLAIGYVSIHFGLGIQEVAVAVWPKAGASSLNDLELLRSAWVFASGLVPAALLIFTGFFSMAAAATYLYQATARLPKPGLQSPPPRA